MFLIFSAPALSEFDSKTAVPVDVNVVIQELLVRNQPVASYKIISICRNRPAWCKGYYTAIIHTLVKEKVSFCLPSNQVGRQNDEGIKSIIESWLYRQSVSKKVRISDAIYKALTEHKKC